MRIAIVSDAVYPYNKGGKEMRIFELSKRLAATGHDVVVYTMKWWDGNERSRVENGVTLTAISPNMPLYSGERRSIRQGILFGVACLRLLNKQFDVVDVDHMPYFPLFFTKLVCVLKRKPMLATWHEVWGMSYWRQYLGTAGLLAGVLEKLTVLLPTRIIAASELTAERLAGDMKRGQGVTTVSNGIDAAAIAAVKPSRLRSDVLFAGRLLEHKNVDMVLRAVAVLKAERPDIRCFIVGDGPERGNLERLARELGLARNVRFFGFVPEHDTVYGLMKASKVFVSGSTREGFGLSVLEANGCGLPVVTVRHADNASTHLVTAVNGRVAEFTAADMAGATAELLDARPNRAAITKLAGTYDWNLAAQRLNEVYAQ